MGIEIINPLDFGAVGNGVTDDTQAFSKIEAENSNKIVDLLGKTYVVSKKFSKNIYQNGFFRIGDKVYDAPYEITRVGNSNVFAGKQAGESNDFYFEASGGYSNVGIGELALNKNGSDKKKVGWKNTAVGFSAMRDNVVGYNNVAVGDSALERNIGQITNSDGKPSATDGGSRNTALGSYALRYNQTGRGNVGVGRNAGHANVTGHYNTAVGTNAYSGTVAEGGQKDEKTASYNTAIGYDSLFNTDADNNTGLGALSGYNNKSGHDNVFIGYAAGHANVSGFNNVVIGVDANKSSKASNRNVSVGREALYSMTAGLDNVAVGTGAMKFLVTGDSNMAIGDLALAYDVNGKPLTSVTDSVGVGKQTRVSGNKQVQLGRSGTTTYAYGAVQDRSDKRDKADIRDTKLGLDFIKQLRPVDFKWDYREDYSEIKEDGTIVRHEKDGSKKRNRYHHGLIAQEVQEVIKETGIDFGGFQDHKVSGGDDVFSIGYQELIAPLIKSVQELNQKIDSLELELKQLKIEK